MCAKPLAPPPLSTRPTVGPPSLTTSWAGEKAIINNANKKTTLRICMLDVISNEMFHKFFLPLPIPRPEQDFQSKPL